MASKDLETPTGSSAMQKKSLTAYINPNGGQAALRRCSLEEGDDENARGPNSGNGREMTGILNELVSRIQGGHTVRVYHLQCN